MIHVSRTGSIELDGTLPDLLSESMIVTDHVLDEMVKNNDKARFLLLASQAVVGNRRLEKVQTNPALNRDVHVMLEEIWNSVRLLQEYIDTYDREEGK